MGGGPARAQGNLIKCQCAGEQPSFEVSCPPEDYAGDASTCITFRNLDGSTLKNMDFADRIFDPSLGSGNDQHMLQGDWVVSYKCAGCTAEGAAPGEPWPADAWHRDADGNIVELPGWDSSVPLTWVFEHPEACLLVPPSETIAVSEWAVFETTRYSDACDYTMTCMYEERSEIYLGRPYWFQAQAETVLFYISRDPIPTQEVSGGFCFPDLAANDAERKAIASTCPGDENFAAIQAYFKAEFFMFIRAAPYEGERGGDQNAFPHRLQFLLKYWQVESGDILSKRLIKGSVIMGDYQRPPEGSVRGYEYDLRITFIPVAWIDVLNEFALGAATYLLFYLAVDFAVMFVVIFLWGSFRLSTKQTNPPRLNFNKWLKGFELNPCKGFGMVVVPIAIVAVFLKFVMENFNPMKPIPGDMQYIGIGAQTVTAALDQKWLDGRIGIMLLVLGFNLMQGGAELLCPRKDMPGSIWQPGYWQRRHVLYTSIWLFIILLLALEFSFSNIFKTYPIVCMLAFKVVWMYMEVWLLKALTEKLIALPFECALQTTQYVMTLGATSFLAFINANIVELSVMVFMRVAVQPIKFRLQRVLKFKVAQKNAALRGLPVPVNTPELEAIGLMSDMLSLMYRFSVDTLGSIISPIAVVVLYLFREPFEISKLYGMRSADLVYFMYFSFFLVPALWVVDIFLFNLNELLWNWKLFEYIQFCNERFANRSRRWVGLDNTINEELPPDLRAMDQMCLSTQFYLLGSLHASGIVISVLGYMLVLHKFHNLFGDPMVMPMFMGLSLFLKFARKAVLRFADRWRIWMVEGETEHEEEYDEGPGSRNRGALPPGMAAVDATIAECVEDAYAAGYTDETLAKLLIEATSYIPPGSSIQVAAGGDGGGSDGVGGGHQLSDAQMQQFLQLQAQGLVPTAQAVPGGGAGTVQVPVQYVAGGAGGAIGPPGMAAPGFGAAPPGIGFGVPGTGAASFGFGPYGVSGGIGAGPPPMGVPSFPGMPGMGYGVPGMAMGGPGMMSSVPPGMPTSMGHGGAGAMPPGGVSLSTMPGANVRAPLPPGVPPPPQGGSSLGASIDADAAFTEFMSAFRSEMRQVHSNHLVLRCRCLAQTSDCLAHCARVLRAFHRQARDRDQRVQKFVPSSKAAMMERDAIEEVQKPRALEATALLPIPRATPCAWSPLRSLHIESLLM